VKILVDRTSFWFRPLGRAARVVVLLVSMLAIAVTAFAGWSSVVARMNGAISTGSGLSGVFVGTGSCVMLSGPGSVVFVSASGQDMQFTASGITPSSVVRCNALWRNTSAGIIRGDTITASQTWATPTGINFTSNWSAAEEKDLSVSIAFGATLPEGGSALPLVISATFVPG